MAPLRFVKMSGAGNDFIVVAGEDAAAAGFSPVDGSRSICRRRLSIGADGVLIVHRLERNRIRAVFYNPDGTEAFCGNGSRCAARFAVLRGWAGRNLLLETAAGEVPAEVTGERVRLILPPPENLGWVEARADGRPVRCRLIRAGVPHLVLSVPKVEEAPLDRWGPELRREHILGPEGANVDLVSRVAPGEIRIRTWERGVEGETLACGSGAVAAALVERLEGGPGAVTIVPRSGIPLAVEIVGDADGPESAILEGDAKVVFEGSIGEVGS